VKNTQLIKTTQHRPLRVKSIIFTRESSYCFQRVLAIAFLSVRLFVTGWISQKRCKQDHQIFTIGCLKNSSFINLKAFP